MSTSQSAYDYSTKGMLTAGVAGFAAVMLIAVGCVQVLQGIAALGNDDILVAGAEYTFAFSTTTWGWVHLGLGLLGIAIGGAILKEASAGYVIGIGLAFVNTISEFAFLPYYPFWSVMVIAFNILVIWALCSRLSHKN
ncbi:MAG TPA: hypothetical protein VFY58_08765 [Nocardioides sp.]|nr:hypothetical protein [Nocardioides sp.]